MKQQMSSTTLAFFLIFQALSMVHALASEPITRSQGQTVYAPVYSHIYIGDRETPFMLAVTLSIRNTDPHNSLKLVSVDYFGSDGKLIKKYLEGPVELNRLASTRYVVKESDRLGGSGASFLITWKADQPISPPLIETVMIGTRNQQGISFSSRGRVIP